MKKIFLIIAALCAVANAGSGTTAANFLKFSISAREAGLAGAYSAVGDGSESVFANPAGLNGVKGKELGFGFASYLQDSRVGLVSYATLYKGSRVGIGLSAYSVDGIERRGLSDLSGVMGESGSFTATDMALSLSYAKADAIPSLIENTDLGVTVKVISSKIDDSGAYAGAVDLGFLYNYNEETKISLMLANAGSELKYEDEGDALPMNLRAGMSYKVKKTVVAAEVSQYTREDKFYPSIGAESELREGFSVRAGYKFGYDTGNLGSYAGMSGGFGIKTSGIGIDYAYSPFGDLGDIHRFDFKVKF